MFYNYFRDYDPATGRYVQSDPIGLQGGLNTYGYVGGNALGAVDPTGEAAVLAAPAFAGAAAVGGGLVCLATNCGEGVVNAAADAWEGAFDAMFPPRPTMAAPGNHADSGISNDYNRYAANERSNCRDPLDRCAWLKKNAHLYSKERVKRTEKAWGCRHSRASKD